MRTMDLENGARAAARSVPAAVTMAEEAKCYVWDARGNGAGGGVSPTLTGDHENRVTDYTAICCENVHPKITGSLCANSHPGGVTGQDANNDMLPTIKVDTSQRKYIVRRLTPLECCRLQGFPDGWGNTKEKQSMTDAEYHFWLKVRQEKEKTAGRPPKDYTPQQILSWYNKLHTDSSEYKMWGNGIALPCAVFVLNGVVDAVVKQRGQKSFNIDEINEVVDRTIQFGIKARDLKTDNCTRCTAKDTE